MTEQAKRKNDSTQRLRRSCAGVVVCVWARMSRTDRKGVGQSTSHRNALAPPVSSTTTLNRPGCRPNCSPNFTPAASRTLKLAVEPWPLLPQPLSSHKNHANQAVSLQQDASEALWTRRGRGKGLSLCGHNRGDSSSTVHPAHTASPPRSTLHPCPSLPRREGPLQTDRSSPTTASSSSQQPPAQEAPSPTPKLPISRMARIDAYAGTSAPEVCIRQSQRRPSQILRPPIPVVAAPKLPDSMRSRRAWLSARTRWTIGDSAAGRGGVSIVWWIVTFVRGLLRKGDWQQGREGEECTGRDSLVERLQILVGQSPIPWRFPATGQVVGGLHVQGDGDTHGHACAKTCNMSALSR